MLSDDEIADLAAELEDFCCAETNVGFEELTNTKVECAQIALLANDEGFCDEDILCIQAAAANKCRAGMNDLPGAKLLLHATKSVASTRFVSSSLCRVIEKEVFSRGTHNVEDNHAVSKQNIPMKSRLTELAEDRFESLDALAAADTVSNSSKNEAVAQIKAAADAMVSSQSASATTTAEINTSKNESESATNELDLNFSFDVLIKQAITKSQDRSRFIQERRRARAQEQEKLKSQHCVIESMCIIITNQWVGSALDQWLKLIRTRKKAERILGRFCRHCLRKDRIAENIITRDGFDTLVRRKIEANNAVLIVDSGFIYIMIFNHDVSGKVLVCAHYMCCEVFFVELEEPDGHHWHSSWSRTSSAWVSGVLRKMRDPFPFVSATELNKHVGTHQVICYPETQMLQCRHDSESYTKFMRAIQNIVMRRALKRFFDHKNRSNASCSIQHAYRCFVTRRTLCAPVNLARVVEMIIYRRLLAILRQHVHSSRAALVIQKVYRGYGTRRRFHEFGTMQFGYDDVDISCILSDDIGMLLDFESEEPACSDWKPLKPMIHTQDEGCGDSNNVREVQRQQEETEREKNEVDNVSIPAEEPMAEVRPKKYNISRESLRDSDEPDPDVRERKSNGFMKQWHVSDKQVAQAMIKKRMQMRRVGSSGLAMKLRHGKR